ncbi:hypothetical protein [Anaerovibrio sp.]|uniref:hypothetical protein n=1 Tax=Anaerovibrio sp. TaxID=1872532 RepID=UPI003F160AD4
MLKGKKKALAAQVLLGLMVAGNAYTVDCGVANAETYVIGGKEPGASTPADDTTHYYAGGWWATGVMLGEGGKLLSSSYSDISNNVVNVDVGGGDMMSMLPTAGPTVPCLIPTGIRTTSLSTASACS